MSSAVAWRESLSYRGPCLDFSSGSYSIHSAGNASYSITDSPREGHLQGNCHLRGGFIFAEIGGYQVYFLYMFHTTSEHKREHIKKIILNPVVLSATARPITELQEFV